MWSSACSDVAQSIPCPATALNCLLWVIQARHTHTPRRTQGAPPSEPGVSEQSSPSGRGRPPADLWSTPCPTDAPGEGSTGALCVCEAPPPPTESEAALRGTGQARVFPCPARRRCQSQTAKRWVGVKRGLGPLSRHFRSPARKRLVKRLMGGLDACPPPKLLPPPTQPMPRDTRRVEGHPTPSLRQGEEEFAPSRRAEAALPVWASRPVHVARPPQPGRQKRLSFPRPSQPRSRGPEFACERRAPSPLSSYLGRRNKCFAFTANRPPPHAPPPHAARCSAAFQLMAASHRRSEIRLYLV